MAVVIRLKRTGAKKDTSFRIVVADSRRARDGRFVEQLGFYDPTPREAQYKVNVERAQYWLGVGAQCSDQVRSLLKKAGVTIPARAKKAKPATTKAAKPAKGTKRPKAKAPSAREKARRERKKVDRVARKVRVAKAKTKAAKKAGAPAATS